MNGSSSASDRPIRVEVADGQGVQRGDHNTQVNSYGGSIVYGGTTESDVRAADMVPTTPIAELDAHALGVAIAALPAGSGSLGSDLGLTPYLERPHDAILRAEISKAALGASLFVLLTGNSTTGKTRALYEGIRTNQIIRGWPLLRPIDGYELNVLLNQERVGPGTALWLNETQRYLFGADGEAA